MNELLYTSRQDCSVESQHLRCTLCLELMRLTAEVLQEYDRLHLEGRLR